MAEPDKSQGLLGLGSDSRTRIIGMAVAVSAVCALVVSVASVALGPRIDANRAGSNWRAGFAPAVHRSIDCWSPSRP